MTCLKLLCTAYRVAHLLKKDFVLAGDRAALFRQAASATADARCVSADQGCEAGCLWADNGAGRSSGSHELRSVLEQDTAAA